MKKNVLIKRVKEGKTEGTLGVLSIDGIDICQTLELPWNNNSKNSSCIPSGKYKCKRIVSPSKGECFEICKVKDRENILIHGGNYLRDSLGCVLVGFTSGIENSQFVVYNSRNALKRFMEILSGVNEFELEIK